MMAGTKKLKKRSTLAEQDRVMDVSDMAMILKPSLKSPKAITKSKVQKVFEWARKEFEKTAELFLKRKSTIILETAKRLEELGIEKQKISSEITKNLNGFVDDSYVRKVLKDYPEYKEAYRTKNAKKGNSSGINPANSAQAEQFQQQEQKSSDSSTATKRSLSNNQVAQTMTQSDGRMGYLNEEHECYKDDIIKQLQTQVKELEERLEKKK